MSNFARFDRSDKSLTGLQLFAVVDYKEYGTQVRVRRFEMHYFSQHSWTKFISRRIEATHESLLHTENRNIWPHNYRPQTKFGAR